MWLLEVFYLPPRRAYEEQNINFIYYPFHVTSYCLFRYMDIHEQWDNTNSLWNLGQFGE